jgi:hypothetical protein
MTMTVAVVDEPVEEREELIDIGEVLEDQDTADVSGISLDGSGYDRSTSARMSRVSFTP